MVFGIDLDRNKDVLGMWIGENETSKFWLTVLNDCAHGRKLSPATPQADEGQEIFPTDEALLKKLYLATMDVTRQWIGRVQNWSQMLLQLSVFFPDRVGTHFR